MIYSRVLYTEHDYPHDEYGDGAYTIFSTQQVRDVNHKLLDALCMQKFAVLWGGIPDTQVIYLIEKAIIKGILAPVKLLHASEGTLVIAYDTQLNERQYKKFVTAWEDIASCVIYESWIVIFIADIFVDNTFESCRAFRKYAPEILKTNDLGITEYTADMFLFWDEWDPVNIFGPATQEELQAPDDPYDFGFNDDVKF
ncbi:MULTISPECIES: hypothetical protein [Pseudomonas]|uniref:hypothetical protein n=1 Tax=Pseudomonas TaxID=286 RepID=UPI000CFEEA15|nr:MULTISPECIES: hypothetical protein [Pseudomonas]PRA51947.1 hypothetical protein CQZ98_17355 [Pseudomonas sp. MYb115]QXN51393.1 hypothetical protein KW062_06480 [Pseudomonas fluorescens]WSO25712.1 hypothetical protein VUJ50_06505 [Pseudomonas fluorescens]